LRCRWFGISPRLHKLLLVWLLKLLSNFLKQPVADPQHWLYRAKQMRRLAADTPEPKTHRMMLSVAEAYDKRAKHAQEKSEATTTIAAKTMIAAKPLG